MAPKNATSRSPLGFCRATASSRVRACAGLTTTRRSTACATFGAFLGSAVIGFSISRRRSTAYSARLTTTPRWRWTVEGAASRPSFVTPECRRARHERRQAWRGRRRRGCCVRAKRGRVRRPRRASRRRDRTVNAHRASALRRSSSSGRPRSPDDHRKGGVRQSPCGVAPRVGRQLGPLHRRVLLGERKPVHLSLGPIHRRRTAGLDQERLTAAGRAQQLGPEGVGKRAACGTTHAIADRRPTTGLGSWSSGRPRRSRTSRP